MIEFAGQAQREPLIEHDHVGFARQQQRVRIDVARPDGCPVAIDDADLGMQVARHVFVDLDAVVEQLTVERALRVVLQGRVEYALQHYAQRALYGQLLDDGIEIHEYVASYLHAKVGVVDRYWATVGSSNIDPYSLLLAREANVVVFDHRFALRLAGELDQAIAKDARPLHAADYARRGLIARGLDWIAYMLVGFATVTLARGRNY